MKMENWKIQELKDEAQFAITLLNGTLDEEQYSNVARDCESTLEDYIQNRFENAMALFPQAGQFWLNEYQQAKTPTDRWKIAMQMIECINTELNTL